ncbi:sugar ABC transporter substrate-binding protein [Pseudomonas mucidolens]|uniref:Monosaccharide ABC transporter substrate-binding protein, CUT2 family n=1 Tax=Pseudomonas mucidolens TaxID=46679 RepID=A0A1H2MGI6_9PSED|nr:sugar ABC transporter substrate-binding protein [Pseudomonas mucidolens]SDU92135.1 monosaccharide ABC transporter substrate-binding protein, CUT2 family [Pseudomonas mucidolens]SQH33935.1 putative D-ribose-binding protein component of ABC transporter [Pseudomonas mucidolens]
MFITKKLLLATAFAAATLGSVGTTWAKDLAIGLAVANLQADFFNQIKQSVEAEGTAKGVKVITVDAQGNSSTQVSQIEDLITRQIDVLIYIPAGATAAGVPVRAAKAAGIPVIAVDRNAPDAPGDTFIASDSVAGAKTLAEYVGKVTEGKGRIAILQGQLGTTPENDRAKGFQEGLKAFPGLEVVAEQPAEWAQDKGFAVAQDLLQRDPNITVFFGRADAMALGAAQAVKVGNLDHNVVVVGFDGDVAGLKAVQSGVLNATMTQQTQKMGRLAVASAIDLKAGKTVPKEQLLETVLTTKDNVAPFLLQHP